MLGKITSVNMLRYMRVQVHRNLCSVDFTSVEIEKKCRTWCILGPVAKLIPPYSRNPFKMTFYVATLYQPMTPNSAIRAIFMCDQ